jgi:uncharacterized protein (DUF58 family)
VSGLFQLIEPLFRELQQLPLLVLLLILIPFLLVAALWRIYPNLPLVCLVILPCAMTFLLLLRQDMLPIVATLDLVVLLLAAVDLFSLPRAKYFTVDRKTQRAASLQKPHHVTLQVSNLSNRDYWVALRDDFPHHATADPDEFSLKLPRRGRATLGYDLSASQRGSFEMERVYLRGRSRLGLWQRFFEYPCASTLHVYPDMHQLAKYAVLARTNRLSLMGVRRTRRVGQDNDFERLRDYTLDDNYKHIDWRSTARRNKLTVKDFQTSQSQRLVFLIDCGRMMTNESSGVSLLDHALNAMLMLSYVALRQGDAVGMLTFSDRVHTYVPPHGGLNQMNQLLHASFDRFPQLVESRYDEAFLHLSKNCRKRSLVILITNVIDEVNALQIQQYLGTMVGRHLPLGILLRDRGLFDLADQEIVRGNELYRSAAAAQILTWRHQVLSELEHLGVLALDTFPEEMTASLVNRYLEIKARHLL